MADINDLLGGINQGLQQGLGAYNMAKERQLKQQQLEAEAGHRRTMESLQALQLGYAPDPITGKMIMTPEKEQEKQLKAEQIKSLIQENKAKTQALLEGKKPSDAQFQAAAYAKRLEQAEGAFGDLASKGYDRASKTQGLLSMAPEALKPETLKLQEQAERNFVNALLRRESGAAISKSEFDSAEKQYFPRAGDTPDVLEQKRQNRLLAQQSLKAAAGKAYSQIPDVSTIAQTSRMSSIPSMASESPQLGAERTPAPGKIEGGYKFIGGDPANPKSWKKVK